MPSDIHVLVDKLLKEAFRLAQEDYGETRKAQQLVVRRLHLMRTCLDRLERPIPGITAPHADQLEQFDERALMQVRSLSESQNDESPALRQYRIARTLYPDAYVVMLGEEVLAASADEETALQVYNDAWRSARDVAPCIFFPDDPPPAELARNVRGRHMSTFMADGVQSRGDENE